MRWQRQQQWSAGLFKLSSVSWSWVCKIPGGRSFLTTMKKVILPLTYTNILVGGILVFVDILKELPITLLLRPFNFETLATYVYQYASDEMLEESSFAAIIIILAGLGPVIFLNSTIKKISKKKESVVPNY